MKVQPHQAFRVLGTGIHLDPNKVYEAVPASNLPEFASAPGLIYVHEHADDPVGVLLREGEYTIIEP